MASIREIILARAKEPAKVHSMERRPPGWQAAEDARAAEVARAEAAAAAVAARKVSAAAGPAGPEFTRRLAPRAIPVQASERRRPRPSPSARPVAYEVAIQCAMPSDAAVQANGGAPTPEPWRQDVVYSKVAAGVQAGPVARRPPTPGAGPGDAARGPRRRQESGSKLGTVPPYLRRRQTEMAEERRLAALPPEPTPPPGYRRVPEEERLDALELLKKQQTEAQQAIQKLPFRIETAGQRRREQELSSRAANLEKLVSMFNRPLVFVPEDSEPLVPARPKPLAEAEAYRNAAKMAVESPRQDMVRQQQPPAGRARLMLY